MVYHDSILNSDSVFAKKCITLVKHEPRSFANTELAREIQRGQQMKPLGYSRKILEQVTGCKGTIRTNHFAKPVSRSKRGSSNAICLGVSLTPIG